MRSPRSRRFWTPARRKDRGRFVAQFIEMLEDRRLMTGFVQGTVLDPNNQPIDAAIVTLSNSTYTASYTTESNGYYAFSSVPAGTYTLTETPPSGYAGSAATAVNATIDPISNVTTQNGSVSVTVQVRDVAGFTGMTYYNTDFEDTYGDTPPAINFYLNQNYGTSGSTPSFISEGDSEPEQLPISAQYTESPAATLGSASDPLTAYCINMFQDLNSSSLVFTVTGSEIPPNLGSGTSTANQGEIAYLYNTYASTLTSSSDAIESSGLQLAIWELIANTNSYLYGASGTGTVTFSQLVNPTTSSPQGNNIVSLSAGPYTSTTQFDGIINDAVSYLNAANGNSQIALGLLFTGPNSEEQSVMISGGINFDNTQQATPSITTAPSPTSVTLGPDSPAVLKDTAQLSGGVNPIGTITFTLVGPNGNTVDSETVPVNGDGAYTTPNGYTLPTSGDVIGTYQWNATFTDTDGQNSNASDNNNPNEQTVVSPASPTIVTTASGPVTLGPGAAPTLSDSAVLAGGYDEGGSLTFTLAGPNGFSYSQVDAVSGDGTYTASTVLPTSGAVAGTYTWSTTYSGDANDNPYTETGSASNGEQTVVSPASPTISTTASGPVTLGPGAAPTLSDSAVLSGGYDEGGSLTFTLAGPNGFSYSQVDAVSGNGTYTASTVLPTTGTVAGTYTWSTTYSGDANDKTYTEVGSASNGEQTVVSPASPTISTTPSTSSSSCSSSTVIKDTATIAGGHSPTGTITFTLYNPNGVLVNTETVTVNGNGSYTTSPGYTLPSTGAVLGTYQWDATYSGDANNKAVSDINDSKEQITIGQNTPGLTTTPGGTVSLGSGITISGTKYLDLTGNGFSSDDVPQNGVTIDLYNSSWTLVASTTTSGNGTFSFSVSSPGTYYVEESVPSGYIQTGGGPLGSAGDTYYQVNAVNGNNYSGYNFDDFAIPNCSSCTGFTYEVATPNGKGGFNKATQVSDLSGHTAQGDQVSVVIPSGATGSYTLVVYSAPTSTFEDSNAYEQVIYQQVSGTYASTASCNHTLTVTIPCNDYQVDFVCGSSINELEPNQNNDAYGPDSAEVLYHAQDRYIDGDNSGTTTPSLPTPPNPTVPNPTSSPATTTQALTDSATLSGGYNPTGTITFYLMAPGSTSSTPLSSAVYTDKVTITGDGTVTTSQGNNPGGYMATVAGTYQWVVVYTGDSDNQGVTSGFGSEPETVAPLPSVTGTVYCDMNVNDALGSGDQGLAGITVTLTGTSAAGAAVNLTTTTNAAGVYSFTGLAPSNSTGYTITLTTPSGDFTETANVGTVNGTAVGSASSITTDTSTEAISKVVLNGTTQTTGINYNFPLLQPATLSGEVIDDGKDDCQQDSCDQGLAGVTVTLTGKNYQGTSVSVSTTTNSSGVYSFSGLAPSNSSGYTVTVSPPSGFTADADWVGTDNGTTDGSASSKSTICDITIGGCGDDAMCYDFSLIGSATCNTQTQSCSYWCGNTGQQQINNCNGSSSCTNLGNWLAQTCPNLFGGLQGCTNSQIAGYCKSWSNGSSSQKACAQVLSTALCAYVTNSNLCGGAGSSYGFSVSQNGLGSSTWNVGSNGSTIGLSNNQTCSVYSVLKQIDSQCSNGSFKNSSVANAASSICSGINGY